MKSILLSLVLLATVTSQAAEVEADFDSLGGNKPMLERAQALEPETNVSIVQNRTVSRRQRWELAPEFSGTFGGDTYNRTRSMGMNVHYHFTPRWSIGAKYNYHFNALTAEGEAMMQQASADHAANPAAPTSQFPEVDYPKSETLALINWYPFYGKMNLLDRAVAHFDVYAVAGYGQVELKSGNTSTQTAGAGVGFWVNQNFSTRMEMRWQKYSAQYATGAKDLDLAVASIQMGWML